MEEKKNEMIYRFLGRTGIKVSALGFGNMVTDKVTADHEEKCYQIMKKAFEAGVNYFDTAEFYGLGSSETLMGKCLKRAGWARKDYVLSTKVYKCGFGVNDGFLSRKHIIEGFTESLKRLQLDYADIAFAHRYDSETPIEEVCRAFNWLIETGKAFYWATSEWTPAQIMEAFECCERLDLIKPMADQCEYNMLVRQKVEVDYVPLFSKYGYGTTIWSPLAGGYLTGKYNGDKQPEGSRYVAPFFPAEMNERIKNAYMKEGKEKFFKRLNDLNELAKELKCTQAQLSLAWCMINQDVSVTLVGASRPEQMEENLKAIELVKKWTPEIEKKIEDVLGNAPEQPLNWRSWQKVPPRRLERLDLIKKD